MRLGIAQMNSFDKKGLCSGQKDSILAKFHKQMLLKSHNF